MGVAVKEKLGGALLHEVAIVRMCRQVPLTVPVRDNSKGETSPENRREVANHRSGLALVGGCCVVDADDEASVHSAVRHDG